MACEQTGSWTAELIAASGLAALGLMPSSGRDGGEGISRQASCTGAMSSGAGAITEERLWTHQYIATLKERAARTIQPALHDGSIPSSIVWTFYKATVKP